MTVSEFIFGIGSLVGERDGSELDVGFTVGELDTVTDGDLDRVIVGTLLGSFEGGCVDVGVGVGEGVGSGVGNGVGATNGAGALDGQPLSMHSKDDASLTVMLNPSQFLESHVREQGASDAHMIRVLPEHASPPVHSIVTDEAPFGLRYEPVQASSPSQRR